MQIRFDGKVVLITGASTGLGAAMADTFGALGAKVVVHYNSSEKAAREVAARVSKAATLVGGGAFVKRIVAEDEIPSLLTGEWLWVAWSPAVG